MSENKAVTGHLLAFITIIIWGTTFISTKILLKDFSPIEILFLRFLLGFILLLLAYPHRLKGVDKKQEAYFALAGLCGVTLYFLLENIALTYSLASNVGVIVSVGPFFTAIFAHWFLEGEKLKAPFFIGFFVCMIGIFLMSCNGNKVLQLNPLGDILAFLAAIVWAVYSIVIKRISDFHYHTIQSTRRIFFYGILFMIPALFIFDSQLNLSRFTYVPNILNILYLGVGASALCFVTWNLAVKILGAVKTSVYIYMVPVITVVTSAIILKEKITGLALVGTILTLAGLFIAESKINLKVQVKEKKERENGEFG